MFKHTKRQEKNLIVFPTLRLIVIFIIAVCLLFLLNRHKIKDIDFVAKYSYQNERVSIKENSLLQGLYDLRKLTTDKPQDLIG